MMSCVVVNDRQKDKWRALLSRRNVPSWDRARQNTMGMLCTKCESVAAEMGRTSADGGHSGS